MLLMSLWITYEVIMRYFLNAPTIWAVDLSEYALLWGTFLAGPWLVRIGGHVRVEALIEHLRPSHQHILGVISSTVAAAVVLIMLWQGLEATLSVYERGQMIARSWQIPRWTVWAAIPLGSFFMVIEFIRAAVRSARSLGDEESFTHHAADERVV